MEWTLHSRRFCIGPRRFRDLGEWRDDQCTARSCSAAAARPKPAAGSQRIQHRCACSASSASSRRSCGPSTTASSAPSTEWRTSPATSSAGAPSGAARSRHRSSGSRRASTSSPTATAASTSGPARGIASLDNETADWPLGCRLVCPALRTSRVRTPQTPQARKLSGNIAPQWSPETVVETGPRMRIREVFSQKWLDYPLRVGSIAWRPAQSRPPFHPQAK
jgi:hypothetical protein